MKPLAKAHQEAAATLNGAGVEKEEQLQSTSRNFLFALFIMSLIEPLQAKWDADLLNTNTE